MEARDNGLRRNTPEARAIPNHIVLLRKVNLHCLRFRSLDFKDYPVIRENLRIGGTRDICRGGLTDVSIFCERRLIDWFEDELRKHEEAVLPDFEVVHSRLY